MLRLQNKNDDVIMMLIGIGSGFSVADSSHSFKE